MKKRNPRLWELLTYVVFGAGTTLVNLLAFKLCNWLMGDGWYLLSNFFAWVLAVAFAYVTNKLWVFESKSWDKTVLRHEIPSFVGARVASFLIEEGGLAIMIGLLHGDEALTMTVAGLTISGTMMSKLILAVIVVILNYFFSKFIIFRKGK